MMKNQFANSKLSIKNQFISKENCGIDKFFPCFSFRYFKHNKYFSKENSNQKECNLYNFLEGLSAFSEKTWGEIKQDSVKFHYHAIENDKSIYKEIKFKDEIPTLYQFKLLGCKQSRIIGFYDEKNNFNIVAYDYSHQIYKRK